VESDDSYELWINRGGGEVRAVNSSLKYGKDICHIEVVISSIVIMCADHNNNKIIT